MFYSRQDRTTATISNRRPVMQPLLTEELRFRSGWYYLQTYPDLGISSKYQPMVYMDFSNGIYYRGAAVIPKLLQYLWLSSTSSSLCWKLEKHSHTKISQLA